MVDWTPELPEVLPLDTVFVEDEQHFFQTYQGDDNSILEKTEYLLDKAPVNRIEEVTGIHDGTTVTFEKGVDYELSTDNTELHWLDSGKHPDAGTYFYVDYHAESIISRYTEAHREEFEETEQVIREVIESKFVDEAEGEELDQLGRLFGKLGKRRGRDDNEYRIYLKSIVQSLISRGTKHDIRQAVAAAIGIDVSEISVTEDFQNTSYDVELPPITVHRGSTIGEIAEIADPSGVDLDKIRYLIDPEEVSVSDSVDITEGIQISTDEVGVDDPIVVDGNKTTISESVGSSDSAAVDPNLVSESDALAADDSVSVTTTTVYWADSSGTGGAWETMGWAREHN